MYDPSRHVNLATRDQFPVKVAYSVTIHKFQGMTLSSVIIDCQFVNKTGQYGVALGRAKSIDGLQVQWFRDRNCLPQPPEVILYHQQQMMPFDPSLSCCHKQQDTKTVCPPSPASMPEAKKSQ